MPVLIRSLLYAILFVCLLLVLVPARLIDRAGMGRPADIGFVQIAGIVLVAAGGALALSCVLAFALVGKGTPAPFDPPRRLVDRGPYRAVRNPMYLGAGAALAGVGLFYGSLAVFGYLLLFALAAHLFVVWYEEPRLRRSFGEGYEDYCRRVGRWWPRP